MIQIYYPVIVAVILFIVIYISYKILKLNIENESEKFIPRREVDKLKSGLLDYAKNLKPTLIIGVNEGGAVISSFVAEEIGFKENNSLYCKVPISKDKDCNLKSSRNLAVNEKDIDFKTILIIDDVCRTGSSIERAIAFIEETYKDRIKKDSIYVAALVTSARAQRTLNYLMASKHFYTTFRTPHTDIRLPWHFVTNDPHIANATKEIQEEKRNDRYDELINHPRKVLAGLAINYYLSNKINNLESESEAVRENGAI